jgi:hypothetical protein
MYLNLQVTSQEFEKWEVDFIRPINPPTRRIRSNYIITMTNYLIRWVEEEPVIDCSAATVVQFLFENIITRFGCPKLFMTDQGTHFLNKTITALTEEFQIQH